MPNFQFNYTKKNGSKSRSTKTAVSRNTKAIKKMLREEEKKYHDSPLNASPSYVAAGLPPGVFNLIGQGDGAGQRNGSRVTINKWQLKYWLSPFSCIPGDTSSLTCENLSQMVRVIAVWFPGVGSINPVDVSLDNVLEAPTDILSHYKKNGKVNFEKIFDRTHRIDYAYTGTQASGVWAPLANSDLYFTHVWKTNKIPTYRDSAAIDPTKGVLAFYCVCQTSPAPGAPAGQVTIPLCSYKLRARLNWTDD